MLAISALDCLAQGPLQKKLAEKIASGGEDGGLHVKDVEGAIWEFKVMESGERDLSQKTKMTGRIRIKQASAFAVGTVELAEDNGQLRDAAELLKEFDSSGDQNLDLNELRVALNLDNRKW